MWLTSSWEDPISPHGDREKPEVSAPGAKIKTTVMSPNLSCDLAEIGSGTSFSDYLTDPLNADLDLYVTGPNAFQYSVRWDNSYEVVDFVATTSGPFQIKVKNFRFDGFNEYLAVAWSLT